MPQGLRRKLRHRFLIQAAVASVLIVAGVSGGCAYALHKLINARLATQATEFWAARAANPGYMPPQTDEISVLFVPAGADDRGLPAAYRGRPVGNHPLPAFDRHLRVEVRPEGTVYLDMSFGYAKRMMWSAAVVLMLLGLLGLYLLTWVTYRAARRLVMPVSWLAGQVTGLDVENIDGAALMPERSPGDVGSEVRQLSSALLDLSGRVRAFVRRERNFTRDASHELRTPLTVIRVASDMLLADPDTPERSRRSLLRIQRAGRDMEAVIDAFLILAREGQIEPQEEEFQVREVVDEEVEKARTLLAGKPVELRVIANAAPVLCASPRVLGVMLGNLLSNACVFTEQGAIEVLLEADRVQVRDTGIGMSPGTLQRVYDPFYRADQFRGSGKGMGLSIVRRLGERFGWPVSLESVPGEGTTAEIRFGS